MSRQALKKEVHTGEIAIEQKDNLETAKDHAERSETIEAVPVSPSKQYLDQLKFMEEPVTIRLEPSTDKNAATMHPVWNNGKGAEILIDGVWREVTYLPVATELTTKRKYVAILAGSKIDTVDTVIEDRDSDRPRNITRRVTTALVTFSIIEDRNPLGRAWLTELVRRNL